MHFKQEKAQVEEKRVSGKSTQRKTQIKTCPTTGNWDAQGEDRTYTKVDVLGDGNCFFYAFGVSRTGQPRVTAATVETMRKDLVSEMKERYAVMSKAEKEQFDLHVRMSYCKGEVNDYHWRVYNDKEWKTLKKLIRNHGEFSTEWAGEEYVKVGTPVDNGPAYLKYLSCNGPGKDRYHSVALQFAPNTAKCVNILDDRPTYVCELCLPYVSNALCVPSVWIRQVNKEGAIITHSWYRRYVETKVEETLRSSQPVYLAFENEHYDGFIATTPWVPKHSKNEMTEQCPQAISGALESMSISPTPQSTPDPVRTTSRKGSTPSRDKLYGKRRKPKLPRASENRRGRRKRHAVPSTVAAVNQKEEAPSHQSAAESNTDEDDSGSNSGD